MDKNPFLHVGSGHSGRWHIDIPDGGGLFRLIRLGRDSFTAIAHYSDIDSLYINEREMKIINDNLISGVAEQAKQSPRLRMNYNFHESLDDKCHRFLNAVEPGTMVEIHRHPTKDESFVLLRGRVRVNTYNDDGIEVIGRRNGSRSKGWIRETRTIE